MDFLTNPLWQFAVNASIGLLTVIVAITVPIVIFIRGQREPREREITYKLISGGLVTRVEKSDIVKDKVELFFDKKLVNNNEIYMVRCQIRNSGTKPLNPQDYLDPIEVHVEEDAEILGVEIEDTDPPTPTMRARILGNLKCAGKSVILEPILLNPKSSVTLHVFQTNFNNKHRVTTEIIGAPVNLITYWGNTLRARILRSELVRFLLKALVFLFSWSLAITILHIILLSLTPLGLPDYLPQSILDFLTIIAFFAVLLICFIIDFRILDYIEKRTPDLFTEIETKEDVERKVYLRNRRGY